MILLLREPNSIPFKQDSVVCSKGKEKNVGIFFYPFCCTNGISKNNFIIFQMDISIVKSLGFFFSCFRSSVPLPYSSSSTDNNFSLLFLKHHDKILRPNRPFTRLSLFCSFQPSFFFSPLFFSSSPSPSFSFESSSQPSFRVGICI